MSSTIVPSSGFRQQRGIITYACLYVVYGEFASEENDTAVIDEPLNSSLLLCPVVKERARRIHAHLHSMLLVIVELLAGAETIEPDEVYPVDGLEQPHDHHEASRGDLMEAKPQGTVGPPVGSQAPGDCTRRWEHRHQIVGHEYEGCKDDVVPRIARGQPRSFLSNLREQRSIRRAIDQ
jgi:hypothetical protein